MIEIMVDVFQKFFTTFGVIAFLLLVAMWFIYRDK